MRLLSSKEVYCFLIYPCIPKKADKPLKEKNQHIKSFDAQIWLCKFKILRYGLGECVYRISGLYNFSFGQGVRHKPTHQQTYTRGNTGFTTACAFHVNSIIEFTTKPTVPKYALKIRRMPRYMRFILRSLHSVFININKQSLFRTLRRIT